MLLSTTNRCDRVKELQRLLAEGNDDSTIQFVKERVLESDRNGIDVGKNAKNQTTKKPAKVAS